MYPILEFDSDSKPIIEPSFHIKKLDGAEYCVMCFFKEVIEKVASEENTKIVATMRSEMGEHPIYEIKYKGKQVAFFHPCIGAPIAAGLMHEAIAYGYKKFVACGGAGVLDNNLKVGEIVIPNSAVRDEGTSYHYIKPGREIEIAPDVVRVLEENLKEKNIQYVTAKTWTTDAFYRETEKRRNKRKEEGCLTAEMECSAFAAVAEYTNVKFGQYLYCGDDISGSNWYFRNWVKNSI